MQKYEYRLLYLHDDTEVDDQKEVDYLAQNGWRLHSVSVCPPTETTGWTLMVFERPTTVGTR